MKSTGTLTVCDVALAFAITSPMVEIVFVKSFATALTDSHAFAKNERLCRVCVGCSDKPYALERGI